MHAYVVIKHLFMITSVILYAWIVSFSCLFVLHIGTYIYY